METAPAAPARMLREARVLGFVLALLAAFLAWRSSTFVIPLACLAVGLAAAALLRPSALFPLARALSSIGARIHTVTNPLVLGLLYFGIMTPAAAVLRLFRRDALRREFDSSASTYWVRRESPDHDEQRFTRQF